MADRVWYITADRQPVDWGAAVVDGKVTARVYRLVVSDDAGARHHRVYLWAAPGQRVPDGAGADADPGAVPAAWGAPAAARGLTLVSSPAGGPDTFDSTARLTVQSYQTNGNNFFGEGVRLDLLDPIAKNMIAWRLPRPPDGSLSTLRSVTWMGAHYYAQDQADIDNPTDVHGHWSIEVPDAADALRTRFEIPFTRPDGTVGVDKTNIKTNLADLTVRAENGQVLRVGAGNAHNKDVVFAIDDGTSGTGTRWRLRADDTTETPQNDGSDFRLVAGYADGTSATHLFVRRKDGRVGIGTTAVGALLHASTAKQSEPMLQLDNTHANPTGPFIVAMAGASSGTALQTGVIGESTRRFSQNMSGRMEWGSGAATRDVTLYRSAADVLKTDDRFEAAGGLTTSYGAAPTDSAPDGTIRAGSDSRVYVRIAGAWRSVAVA